MSPPQPTRTYPRTRHLEGSGGPGAAGDRVRLTELGDGHLVVEEKVDGAHCRIGFDASGRLLLGTRGGELTGGPREAHLGPLKAWASCHQDALHAALGDRFVIHGEWMWAAHTVYYDRLPHLLLEFDVLDADRGVYLSTPARRRLLAGLPLVSVPVLHEGPLGSLEELTGLLGPSLFKSPRWREALAEQALLAGADPALALARVDDSDLPEGLYVKLEDEDQVLGRFKWVRPDFLAAIRDSGSHWRERRIIANRLAPGVDIHGPAL